MRWIDLWGHPSDIVHLLELGKNLCSFAHSTAVQAWQLLLLRVCSTGLDDAHTCPDWSAHHGMPCCGQNAHQTTSQGRQCSLIADHQTPYQQQELCSSHVHGA